MFNGCPGLVEWIVVWFYRKYFGFVIINVVTCVCSVSGCYACYLILNYLLVVDIIGTQVVQAYSRMGLVMDLYVWISVFLFLPHDVYVSAL